MLTNLIRRPGSFNKLRSCFYASKLMSTDASPSPLGIEGSKFQIIPRPPKHKIFEEYPFDFVKDLFKGTIDPSFMEFPEVLDNDDVAIVGAYTSAVAELMETVDHKELDEIRKIPDPLLDDLKYSNLFALHVPRLEGGHSFNETEMSLVYEALSKVPAINKLVQTNQSTVLPLINWYASPEQKLKFYADQLNGRRLGALAIHDSMKFDDYTFNESSTQASLSKDKQSYVLNGEKLWVHNATIADYFIVSAKTIDINEKDERREYLSFFIVDKNTPGIKISKPIEKIGLKAVPTCDIYLKDVHVPMTSILGELHQGKEMRNRLLLHGKHNTSAQMLGSMRRIINSAIAKCLNEQYLYQAPEAINYVHELLARMCMKLYAAESMHYLIVGKVDTFKDPDVQLESSLVKVYASEALMEIVLTYMQLFGVTHLRSDVDNGIIQRDIEDAHYYLIGDELNVNLKLAVTFHGLKECGSRLAEQVKKVRNVLSFPLFMLKKKYALQKKHFRDEGPDLGLKGYVHPSLDHEIYDLQHCVSKCETIVEIMLTQHGGSLIKKHADLLNIADIATMTFALTAAISRASRSYCIGLANADTELLMVKALSAEIRTKIDEICARMVDPKPTTLHHPIIAQQIMEKKCYPIAHPTTRNW